MKKFLFFLLFITVSISIFFGLFFSSDKPTKVVLWNWSLDKKAFYEKEAAEFNRMNPDVQVEWVFYAQDQYDKLLPLALSSGTGPDLFWIRPEEFPQQYIAKGWIRPIDRYIDKDTISMFDRRVFVEGAMYFKGKLYTMPYENRYAKIHGLMFYNNDVLKKAGYKPYEFPKSFSEFRKMAKDITEKGKGQYYGVALNINPASEIHRILNGLFATSSVASGDVRYGTPGFDERTGKFTASDKEHQEIVQFLIDLVKDGSIVPGWQSMKKEQIRALFAEGKAAFFFDGTWMPGTWANMGYKNFDYGITDAPVPDSGRRSHRFVGAIRGDIYVNSKTKDMEKTMKVYKWLLSKEFAQKFFEFSGEFPGNQLIDLSKIDLTNKKPILDMYNISLETVRIGPSPTVRNPDTGKVQWPSYTGLWDIITAAMVKQDINYYIEEAKKWDEKMTRELNQNIKKAQDEGAKVSIKDFTFSDWDPSKEYSYSKKK